MKLNLIFAWYDLWVGFFWDKKKRWLYFFPVPMVGIVLKFKSRNNENTNTLPENKVVRVVKG